MYSSSVSPSTAEPNYVLPYNAKCKRKLAALSKVFYRRKKERAFINCVFLFLLHYNIVFINKGERKRKRENCRQRLHSAYVIHCITVY